jgi:nucleoside-diphosphate-sugar epimerase
LARALIIGCGCRGRELGERLLAAGWAVRGTSRSEEGLAAIEAAGIEAALADPNRVGTVLEHVGDVAIVFHLLGSATGEPGALAEIHGPRLERLLEKVVDTPVRGVVYEAVGSVDAAVLEGGAGLVEAASRTWRIPAEVVMGGSNDPAEWSQEMVDLAVGLLSPAREVK